MPVRQKEKITLSAILYVKSNSYCKPSREEVSVRPIPVWWSLGGSNSWPPACKAGALPAELKPHVFIIRWWAWMDLNQRPHPYQGCALTTWATGPIRLPLHRMPIYDNTIDLLSQILFAYYYNFVKWKTKFYFIIS